MIKFVREADRTLLKKRVLMYYGKAWLNIGYLKRGLVYLNYPLEADDVEQLEMYRSVMCR